MVVERAGAGEFLTLAGLKTASVMDTVAASESCAPVQPGTWLKVARTSAVAAAVACQRPAAASREHPKHQPDPLLVDIFRIERSAVPLPHPVMLFVARFEHRLEKLHEAIGSADIFRRTAASTVHECRVFRFFAAIAKTLHHNVVAPVVAEVVHIEEAVRAALDKCLQTDGRRVMPDFG